MIRNSDRSCADWVQDICRDGGRGWTATCDAVLKIYRDKIMACSPTEPGNETIGELKDLVFGGQVTITDNQAIRLYARLSDQSVDVMLAAVPRDSIAMTWRPPKTSRFEAIYGVMGLAVGEVLRCAVSPVFSMSMSG